MPKILMIANASSVWTKELIRNIHFPFGHEVTLATFDMLESDSVKLAYKSMNTRVVNLGSSYHGAIGKIYKSFSLLKLAFLSRHLFDFVIVHCPPNSFQAYIIAIAIKLIDTRTLTVFWGSDIQAIDCKGAKKLSHIVGASNSFNLGTVAMQRAFYNFFELKKTQKIYSSPFGSLAFSSIDEVTNKITKQECKKYFGLNPEKTCIAVGHSGKASHQHLLAIEALAKLPNDIKDRLQMLLHLHQGEDSYIKQVCKMAKAASIEFTVIPHSLGLEEVAKLRVATDIFLHAQKNDALSGSIRECLYAEAILINPTWIEYDEYDELGIEYIKFSKFEELPEIIKNVLVGEIKVDTVKNHKIVDKMYSWNAVKRDWLKIFDENIT